MTGLTNGSSYTFKVSATNAVGTGAAVGGLRGDRAAPDDLRLRDAGHGRQRGDGPGQRRGQVHRRRLGSDHRSAVLQGRGEHRHAYRQPVRGRRRRAARTGDVRQRDRVRLAVRAVLEPGQRHRRHHIRGVVLRAQRPLLGDAERPRVRGRQRPAARDRQRYEQQRRVHIRSATSVPERELPGRQLLGRRAVRRRVGARAGHRRQRHRRPGLGDGQLERAGRAAARPRPTRSLRTSARTPSRRRR